MVSSGFPSYKTLQSRKRVPHVYFVNTSFSCKEIAVTKVACFGKIYDRCFPGKNWLFWLSVAKCGAQVTSSSPRWVSFTTDFPCMQFQFYPTWRKSLFPLNPRGMVAHYLWKDIFGDVVVRATAVHLCDGVFHSCFRRS